MKKLIFSITLYLSLVNLAFSQVANPVNWKFESKIISENTAELKITANIDAGYHMYGVYFAEGGPVPTSFHFTQSDDYAVIGKIKEVTPPEKRHDASFDMDITIHNGKAIFTQQVKLKKAGLTEIKGSVEWMACTDKNCLPPVQKEFVFSIENKKEKATVISAIKATEIKFLQNHDSVKVAEKHIDSVKTSVSKVDNKTKPLKTENKSLWGFFLISILIGFTGVITPCVYPMIPMTVSFFLRGNDSKIQGILKGLLFGISIVVIYALVGVLAAFFGSNFANQLSSHWIANSLFFLLFLLFSASFLGMFEIVLPSSIVNKTDQQADKGGYLGIVFMALATVLVSFSCTGPIVSSLLIEASQGISIKPIVGMLGYGLAFAIPFTFFAISPASLKSLPKSGGWLNSVKVVLGLLMLAFSIKFIVNIDQTYNLNLISRDVVIGIWIVLSLILGFYLLGKLKFAHDSEVKYISVPRLLMAVAAFTFAIYLATGFGSNNLAPLASMLPPAIEKSSVNEATSTYTNKLCSTPKYNDIFHLPYGIQGYFELQQGLSCAKAQNKPVFIDFKGHSCSNCKIMEASVWSDKQVQQLLKDEFIVIALYTDDKTELLETEQIVSTIDGKKKQTIGDLNGDIQISKYNSNALPYYVIANTSGKALIDPIGFENNVDKFKAYLESGLKEFRNK